MDLGGHVNFKIYLFIFFVPVLQKGQEALTIQLSSLCHFWALHLIWLITYVYKSTTRRFFFLDYRSTPHVLVEHQLTAVYDRAVVKHDPSPVSRVTRDAQVKCRC